MIDPVTGWFEVTQCNNNREISIENLSETMVLSRYPRPIKITYEQVKSFIGHELKKYLIQMIYRIIAKSSTSVNPTFNAIL